MAHTAAMADGVSYAANLRREICSRNAEYARQNNLDHVSSYGREPVIVYAPQVYSPNGNSAHGNFFPASYKAIQKNANWRLRLNKVHTQGRTSLPKADRRWRELDSCVSSDALLMNIFCCPRVLRCRNLAAMLGIEPSSRPKFGYRPRVPLSSGHIDRTEVDLKLGDLLIEAKLTEGDFQTQSAKLVESYRDLEEVFDVGRLPRIASVNPIDPFPDYDCEPTLLDDFDHESPTLLPNDYEHRVRRSEIPRRAELRKINDRYISYQLIRNVLAAHAGGNSFCVITDQRRPDLMERWHAVMRCVGSADLRTRCKVLTWQELAAELPPTLQTFLLHKYGIESARAVFRQAD